MAKSFNLLRKKMSLEAQKAAKSKTKEKLKEMPMQELRQAHQMMSGTIKDVLSPNLNQIEYLIQYDKKEKN